MFETDHLDFHSETFVIHLRDEVFKFQGLKESISFPFGYVVQEAKNKKNIL